MQDKTINLDKLTPKQLQAEDLLSQAILLINAEKYDESLELLQRAQEITPQEIYIYLRQAQVYIIRDQYQEAEAVLDKAAYIDKMDGRIYFHKGNIRFLQGRFDEAIEQFGQAEECGVKNASMSSNMGFAYEHTGKVSQALQAYAKAIRLDPENPMYRYRRIALLLANNEVDAASEMLADFLKRFPNVKEGYVLAVDALFRQEKYAEAEKLLLDVLKDQGEDADLQALLVRAYALLNKHKEAIALGHKILENSEASEQAVNDVTQSLPRLYLLEGEVDKGLELLKKAIESEKEGEYNLGARTLMITMLAGLKRHKELLTQVEDILAKPELADRLYMAYMLKGLTLKELGRSAEALEANRVAVKKLRMVSIRNPMAVDAHIFRAMCHQGLAEYEEALEELKIVERLGVESKEFYTLRAAIYEAMGKKDEAEADKKKVNDMQTK